MKKILIVEDQAPVAKILTEILELVNFQSFAKLHRYSDVFRSEMLLYILYGETD
jgi:hypothetical protein